MNRRGFLAGTLGLAGLTLAMPSVLARPPGATAEVISGPRVGTTRVRVPGFLPSERGLHFVNEFPHLPVVEIALPFGLTIPIGDAAKGLCGGMVYAVRDLYEARATPMPDTEPPGEGPAFRYLADRLLDSFSLPFGPATYLKLMDPAMPDGDEPHVHGRAWRMIRQEWPAIQRDLDRGTLSPLGLVKTISGNPLDLGRNHQVLAWGYDLHGSRLTLRIYDPNHPEDDKVTLRLDLAHPQRPTPVHCSHDGPVYCFFRTSYQFKNPDPALVARPGSATVRRSPGAARRAPRNRSRRRAGRAAR